jgi:hypothetical protein
MAYILDLKTEIDGDPLVRGYVGMTDLQVANDMNTLYRDADGNIQDLFDYLVFETSRTNNGADTTATYLWGRLQHVADSAVGANPFGTGVSGNDVTLAMKHAATSFMSYVQNNLITTNFNADTRFDAILQLLDDAGILKPSDITAIKGFSQNLQTRGNELFGRTVKEGHVTQARSI